MSPLKRYVVMYDCGAYEGWRIEAECDTLLEAVEARENKLRSGGGAVEIFEYMPHLEAYRSAKYHQDEHERKLAERAKG